MEQIKIVLIGNTGDGKSSAGNTILGEKVFTTNRSANSITAKSERRDGLVHGKNITVIDTPGFFDPDCEDEEIKSEITKSLIECAPGVHGFVIVLRVGRHTPHKNEVVLQFLNATKGEHVLKHTVILFTHGDQLDGQTIKEFVKANPQLQELVDKCGGRCHVIDNKYWNDCDSGYKSNRVQVKNLLDTIDTMVKENGDLLQDLQRTFQEEMKTNEDNLPPGEKREKDHFCYLVAVATAWALIYAFLCALVAGAVVQVIIRPIWFLIVSRTGRVSTAAAVKHVPAGVVGAGALIGAVLGAVSGWKTAKKS